MKLILIAISALLCIQHSLQDDGCGILRTDPLDRGKTALFLNENGDDFLYPPLTNYYSTFSVPVGEKILISCPGSRIIVLGVTPLTTAQYAVCGQDSRFHIDSNDNDSDISFIQTDIICEDYQSAYPSIRENSEPCGINGVTVNIGFEIGIDDKFLVHSTVCFDSQELIAQYSHYNFTQYSKFAESILGGISPMPQDPYYPANIDIGRLYLTGSLQKNINPTLGLPENSTKYFGDEFTFSEEILTPSEAFMYEAQQMAGFRLINTVPNWLTLFNWESSNIRDYVRHYDLDLEVYTGTHGVLTFPHEETGEPVEIYLYQSEETGRVVKVPEILWSLVYEPISKRALVIVVHNNVHLDIDSVENYCTDIYYDVQWFTWEHPNQTEYGYGYLCSYDDAKSSVPEIPEIEVTGILY